MSKKAKTATPPQIHVDIVSDIVCPWCWLGKRYFDKALTQTNAPVSVTWRPYMLDPSIPPEGQNYGEYMRAKFDENTTGRFKLMRDHLEAAAPEAGINYRFSDIPMRPNTLRAHKLVYWAQNQGLGSAAVEALFKAFFDELRDIGDIDVLAIIAQNIGMDASITRDLLEDKQDADAVNAQIKFFQDLGVSGVPTFIYNGQLAISGAQSPQAHLQAMEQAANLPVPNER